MAKKNNGNKVYINSDGEQVMRITEIIKVLAKDQITLWANMIGLKGISYKKELDRTAAVGTMMHAVLEDFMNPRKLAIIDYEEYDINDDESIKETRNSIESFIKWYKPMKPYFHVKFLEKEFVGKHYGGTIDCGIDGFENPNKVIFVDYKSSGFYLSQFLQLAGYVRIYEELNGPDTVVGVMVIVMNKKDGSAAKARFIPRENMEMILVCFDCLYNTALMTKMLNSTWWRLGEDIK